MDPKFFDPQGKLKARAARRSVGGRKGRRSGTKSRKAKDKGLLSPRSGVRIKMRRRELLRAAV